MRRIPIAAAAIIAVAVVAVALSAQRASPPKTVHVPVRRVSLPPPRIVFVPGTVAVTPSPKPRGQALAASGAPGAGLARATPAASAGAAPLATGLPPNAIPPLATLAPSAVVPPVEIAAPDAPPRIIAISLSPPQAAAGQMVSGKVETTSNVASVEARVAGRSASLQKTGVGQFEMSYRVPRLPFFLRHTYWVQIIARNAAGLAVSSAVPITIR